MSAMTFAVKTFEAPGARDRLLRSIRKLRYTEPILVADDSRFPTPPGFDAQLLALPYDVGLSAGRNALIDAIDTPYTLMLDDDFIFSQRTDIERLHRILDTTDIDLVAGRVFNCPHGYFGIEGLLTKQAKGGYGIQRGRYHSGTDECAICDIVPNFFLARTDKLREVRWDEELKLAEHVDFFIRALGKLKVATCPSVVINHQRLEPSDIYKKMRGRGTQFGRRYAAKYGMQTPAPPKVIKRVTSSKCTSRRSRR